MKCEEWLKEFLSDVGETPQANVMRVAEKNEYTENQVNYAASPKKGLVKKRKKGMKGVWYWSLRKKKKARR